MNLSEILRIFLLDRITKYNFFIKHFLYYNAVYNHGKARNNQPERKIA